MATCVELSQSITKKKENYARISRVVIDLFTRIMRDILLYYYPCSADLHQKIKNVKLEQKFKRDMNIILAGDGYEKCDVSLLYKLIRGTCEIIPPTITPRRKEGWGGDKIPSRDCKTVGDDIERIRIIRNRICGHIYIYEMEDNIFQKYFDIAQEMCERLQGTFGTDYVLELYDIKTCRLQDDMLVSLTKRVTEDIEKNEDLRTYIKEESRKVLSISEQNKERIDEIHQEIKLLKSKDHKTISRLREEVKQLKEKLVLNPEDVFRRNYKGIITSLTETGFLIIGRKPETEAECQDTHEKTKLIINTIIMDICGSKGGINLQTLESRFGGIFRSPFKKVVGIKLLDYLRTQMDLFHLYKKGNQFKVMLAGNNPSVKCSKQKEKKIKRSKSNKKSTHVEEFDIKLIYPEQQLTTEENDDLCIKNNESVDYSENDLQNVDEWTYQESNFDWFADDEDDDNDENECSLFVEDESGDLPVEKITAIPEQQLDSTELPTLPRENITFSSALTKNKVPYKKGKIYEKEIVLSELQKMQIAGDKMSKVARSTTDTVEAFEKQEGESQLVSLKSPEAMSQSMSEFFEKVHNFEKSSESFALVVGKTNFEEHIESLASIPWLCVFDFDMFSRENGLMSVLDGHINKIHPCTLKDRPVFSFSTTYWCLLRGDSQVPDTCVEGNVTSWIKLMKKDIKKHLKTLSHYISNTTIMKVVLLWPNRSDDMTFINRFLIKMEEIIEPEIFVIHPKIKNESLFIEPTFKFEILWEFFYSYLKSHLKKITPKRHEKYRLPTYNKTNDPGIDEYTASHLKEYFNILYLSQVDPGYSADEIREEEKNFLRGGTLSWFVYYERDSSFDVTRDQMQEILNDIRSEYIKRSKSTIIKVYHSPGAGGTTLSQRILWELHKEIPCVQVKFNIHSKTSDIVGNMKLLSEKTHLPILILLDGRNDWEVRDLYKQLKLQSVYPIILHIQRTQKELNQKTLGKGKYWIKGKVTKREAKIFFLQYITYCDTAEKSDNLTKISDDAAQGGDRQVYEFGLTTFAHEFKGVDAYVRGYLQLDSGAQLNSTQKLLGYLSLIYFYGQLSVPCELFSKLLGKERGITFDDLPYEARQLVVKSSNHQHIGFMRICHQIVAKEVLEQILTKDISRLEKPPSQNLSKEASRNLLDFGLDFIEYMKTKSDGKIPWSRDIIVEILTKTFVQRDEQDIGESNFIKRKPKFSRFFTDIANYTSKLDRIRVMERLTSCFPNPNFYAHLGRMYTLYFPGEKEDTAERNFEKAISFCHKEMKINEKEGQCTFDEQFLRPSVFHMYGIHFYQRICWLIRARNDSEEAISYNQVVETVLEYAQKACMHFETSREHSFPGLGETYGLTGEIMVRTEVCNYIKKNVDMSFSEFLNLPMSPVVEFVRESMVLVCELITRCYSIVDRDEIPPSMSHHVILYKNLFKGQKISEMCALDGPIDCTKRRHFITQIKLKYDSYDILSLNNKTPSENINDIIFNLEENFKDLEKTGIVDQNKRSFESDFKDWINAIRLNQYDKEVPIEVVMDRVHQWHQLINTPTSKFYAFVMCALSAILNKDTKRFIDAKDMLDEVKKYKNHFMKPHKPKEWLGVGSGIKCLIPGLFSSPKGDSSVDEIEFDKNLAVRPLYLRGTISGRISRPLCGYISTEVCSRSQFDVFFVPARTKEKLVGSIYSNQHVEFILGFNASNGFIAYNVKKMEKVGCERCHRQIEFLTGQIIATCPCGKTVQKVKADDVFYPDFEQ